jgi:hypothetical protein
MHVNKAFSLITINSGDSLNATRLAFLVIEKTGFFGDFFTNTLSSIGHRYG